LSDEKTNDDEDEAEIVEIIETRFFCGEKDKKIETTFFVFREQSFSLIECDEL
jgi:hypothetical protein